MKIKHRYFLWIHLKQVSSANSLGVRECGVRGQEKQSCRGKAATHKWFPEFFQTSSKPKLRKPIDF